MFFKNKLFIFIAFILLIFTILTYQSIKGKSLLSNLSYPVHILSEGNAAVIRGVKKFFNTYLLIVNKEAENRRLLDNLKRLEHERNRYIEAELENKRLRRLLKLKSERVDYITVAEVFARDPTNWFRLLWINKGSDDGIAKDMVAVTPVGLVGRIHNVFKNRASVILITDVNSSVAVRIQPSRIEGILEGRGGDMCFLKYVSQEADVRVGQRVITSGLDGIYPKGLLTGYVTHVKKKEGELFQEIVVKPVQEFNTIEEVAVLKR